MVIDLEIENLLYSIFFLITITSNNVSLHTLKKEEEEEKKIFIFTNLIVA